MILVDENTRVLVQGITGREASFHARRCIEYGTQVVAGVTPGKGTTVWEDTVPVFNSVEEARRETDANASLLFVPAAHAKDAIIEAAEAGLPLVVCITELIPTWDEIIVHRYLETSGARLVGPNCPGVISPPARCKMGIMPGSVHTAGEVGVVSRSGTLTYEVVAQLSAQGLGQSTCVGIGGDPLPGSDFVDIITLFEADPGTRAIVMVGEIGGSMEQDAANYIRQHMSKPVVAFVAGASAPPDRRMGHAGAIVSGASSSADSKKTLLREAGATVVDSPADIGATLAAMLSGK